MLTKLLLQSPSPRKHLGEVVDNQCFTWSNSKTMAHPTLTELQIVVKAILQVSLAVGYGNELHQHLYALLPEQDQAELKRAALAVAAQVPADGVTSVSVDGSQVIAPPAAPQDPVVA